MSQNFHSGQYQKHKVSKSQTELDYEYFLPSCINQSYQWQDQSIDLLLEEASRELGELNAFFEFVPDANQFIHMYAVKEAVSSSQIEGTQTNVEEAVSPKDEISLEKRDDWQEVKNYIEALNLSIAKLEKLPISARLIKEAHYTLLQGVRGESKLPGEFRKSQNWIGGSNLQDASFVPPHQDQMTSLIKDFEDFIHNDQLALPHLIKSAILHYQFETIHPFLDGNGRIGRLIITLYLIDKEIITRPCLYLSDFFERNRNRYYDSLSLVRTRSDLDQWLKFFLQGLIETTQNSKSIVTKILALKLNIEERIASLGSRAKTAEQILAIFFSQPVLDYEDIVKELGVTHPTANKYLSDFMRLGIIDEVTLQRKNRLYRFTDYIRLFDS